MMPWPGKEDPVLEARYELVVGFNDKGEPVYGNGVDDSPERMRTIGNVLGQLRPVPASITSVTMGSVQLLLKSGAQITLSPVFHIGSGLYGDLFKVDGHDLPMPDDLAVLLNRWRDSLKSGESSED